MTRWLIAAAFVGGALLIGTGAQAQTCAPDDLRCRVDQLEARLAALEILRPASTQPATTIVNVRRTCASNCADEAAAVCRERAFANGRPEDWERPRSGPVTLLRAACAN